MKKGLRAQAPKEVEIWLGNGEIGYRKERLPILDTFEMFGETFVIHNDLKFGGGVKLRRYMVAHLGTGAHVNNEWENESKKIAIESAKRRLKDFGPEEVLRRIKRCAKENARRKRESKRAQPAKSKKWKAGSP